MEQRKGIPFFFFSLLKSLCIQSAAKEQEKQAAKYEKLKDFLMPARNPHYFDNLF